MDALQLIRFKVGPSTSENAEALDYPVMHENAEVENTVADDDDYPHPDSEDYPNPDPPPPEEKKKASAATGLIAGSLVVFIIFIWLFSNSQTTGAPTASDLTDRVTQLEQGAKGPRGMSATFKENLEKMGSAVPGTAAPMTINISGAVQTAKANALTASQAAGLLKAK